MYYWLYWMWIDIEMDSGDSKTTRLQHHVITSPLHRIKVSSAVTETVPESETMVFCQNHGEPKLQYFWS